MAKIEEIFFLSECFFFILRFSSMKREEREKRLKTLKELFDNPITRNNAYKICAEKFGTTVAAREKPRQGGV